MSTKKHCDLCDKPFNHSGGYEGVFEFKYVSLKPHAASGDKVGVRLMVVIDLDLDGQPDLCTICADTLFKHVAKELPFGPAREEAAKPGPQQPPPASPEPKDVLGHIPPMAEAKEVFKQANQAVRLGSRRMT